MCESLHLVIFVYVGIIHLLELSVTFIVYTVNLIIAQCYVKDMYETKCVTVIVYGGNLTSSSFFCTEHRLEATDPSELLVAPYQTTLYHSRGD
jgi:hypothetical protein